MSATENDLKLEKKSQQVSAYISKFEALEDNKDKQSRLQQQTKAAKNSEFAEIGRMLSAWATELRSVGNHTVEFEERGSNSKQHHLTVQGQKFSAGNYDDEDTIYLSSDNTLVTFVFENQSGSTLWRIKNHKSMNNKTCFTSEELAETLLNEPMDKHIANAQKMY